MHNVEAAMQEVLAKQEFSAKEEAHAQRKPTGSDQGPEAQSKSRPAESVLGLPHLIGYAIEFLGLILAVTAIIYAYEQKKDSEELKNRTDSVLAETKEAERNTRDLVSSMTTHYVAPFPLSMNTITEKVRGTCATLDAMVDVPGYGHYSSPEMFYEYQKAITETALLDLEARMKSPDCISKGQDLKAVPSSSHPKIRVLLFAPEDRVSSGTVQYNEFKTGLKENPQKTKQFLHFFERNPDLLDEDPKQFLERVKAGPEFEQFRRVLLTRHCVYERELRKSSIQVRYAKQQYITRLWIIDKLEAVFSFDHRSVEEIAFRSSDRDLLRNFNGIFESWWQDGVPYSVYWNLRKESPTLPVANMPRGGKSDDPLGSVANNSCEAAIPTFLAASQ